MKEKELLEQFKKILMKKHDLPEDSFIISPGNKSKEMDFVIKKEDISTVVCLEAKVFNDTRSNSNAFLSLFGKIIKGRCLNKNSSVKSIKFKEYGYLFSKANMEIIKSYFSIISFDDWKLFCESFDVKRIYVVGDSDYELYSWKEFHSLCDSEISSYLGNSNILDNDDDVT